MDAIADAIRDHYKPQGPADSVPTAPLTVAVALADKLDTLVGFFAIDEKPTGSKDPFALRRAALGVIRLVLENGVRLPLKNLAAHLYENLVVPSSEGLALYLEGFEDLSRRHENTWGEDLINELLGSPLAFAFNHDGFLKKVTPDLLILSPANDDYPDEPYFRAVRSVSNRAGIFESYADALKFAPNHQGYVEVGDQRIQLDSEAIEARRTALLASRAQVEPFFRAFADDIGAFFADRLKVLLRDQGKRHDLVDAVFALGDDDLVRIVRRVEALDAFLATDDGANLLAGYKRASNILRAEGKKGELPTGMVETGLPNQPEAETVLAMATAAARTAVDTALETEDFAAAMTALAALRGPVDAFFTDVMVNSDVPAERENRLKLLGQVRDVMGRVADFGQVAG